MTNDPFTHRLAELLNAEPKEVLAALERLALRIRSELEQDGIAVVEGLGTFRATDGGVTLDPEPRLSRYFNRPYESLKPVVVQTPAGDTSYQKTDIVPSHETGQAEPGAEEEEGAEAERAEETEPAPVNDVTGEKEPEVPEEPETPEEETVEPEDAAPAGPVIPAEAETVPEEEEAALDEEVPDTGEPVVQPPEAAHTVSSNGPPPVEEETEPAAAAGEPEELDEFPPPTQKREVPDEAEHRRRPVWIPLLFFLLIGGVIAVYVLTRPIGGPTVVERPAPEQPAPADEPRPADVDPDAPAPVDEPAETPAAPEEPFDPLRGNAIHVDRGGYTWIYASLPDMAAAEEVAQDFRRQGFRSGVIVERTDARTFYRVGVGQFQTQEEATAALNQMPPLPANTPGNPWLRRINQ